MNHPSQKTLRAKGRAGNNCLNKWYGLEMSSANWTHAHSSRRVCSVPIPWSQKGRRDFVLLIYLLIVSPGKKKCFHHLQCKRTRSFRVDQRQDIENLLVVWAKIASFCSCWPHSWDCSARQINKRKACRFISFMWLRSLCKEMESWRAFIRHEWFL